MPAAVAVPNAGVLSSETNVPGKPSLTADRGAAAGAPVSDARPAPAHRGLATCSILLTIATLALLVAAILGLHPAMTPAMVGVAAVGLAVSGRAAAHGSLTGVSFALVQFLLIVSSLAGVVMILAD